MGVISVEQTDRLYWLGRYAERVYTTIRLYFMAFDTMIDHGSENYRDFCARLDIPEIYGSADAFRTRYPFDESDCNSIISNLKRAYDNAIVLREEIGSEALSYIQLAMYAMQKARQSEAPLLEFQQLLDNLMAFWGMCDDWIADENVRNILKVGKRVERIDLYGRLHQNRVELTREVHRLTGRVPRCNLKYRPEVLTKLAALIQEEAIDYPAVVATIEQFLA